MRTFETLQLEQHDAVATLWMARAGRHNAFDETLIAELEAALRLLDDDQSVRIVVLAGRGKSFSAGADLDWMRRAAAYEAGRNLADAQALASMLGTLDRLSKPTIARVHGAALGGGMGLVAACDIAIAGEQAVFATSEVRFGLIPATIGPYVLRAIGTRHARRYFQTAERIDARQACAIGLLHEVVTTGQLDTRIDEVIRALLAGGPQAQASAKRLVADIENHPLDEALHAELAARIAAIRGTDEAREGVAAFLEKRPANWNVPR